MKINKRIAIAMSGGVDSSVAAALLLRQGCEVIGMMLRLWSEPGTKGNLCCTPDAMELAQRVAAQLDIPFYAVDARDAFYETVVQGFISGYAHGVTPNPCLLCNRHIRWGFLLERALTLGADFMATGHYARRRETGDGRLELLRAADPHKDQSYVLHILDQTQLSHSLFPLGEYTKPQVREMARDFGLPVAERPDSQDLCFVGDGDYHDFLRRHAPHTVNPGTILTRDGRELGQHQGLAFYTIGQRKGLGIASPCPLYVLEKDIVRNILIVGRKEEMGNDELTAGEVNWISGEPPTEPIRVQVKIRYKSREAWGRVTPLAGGRAHIKFEEPLLDITPGQAAVFYEGEVCLGGGIIE